VERRKNKRNQLEGKWGPIDIRAQGRRKGRKTAHKRKNFEERAIRSVGKDNWSREDVDFKKGGAE